MMLLKSSDLDRQITIQRGTASRDSYHNLVMGEPWADLITVRASKKDVSDGERIASQEVGADITTRFRVRWNKIIATVTPKDRLVCEGKTYNISGVKEIGRRVGREISATTRTDK